MIITIAQICTILCLLGLVCCFAQSLCKGRHFTETNAETLWVMKAHRVGKAQRTIRNVLFKRKELQETIELHEDVFIMGNGVMDDIYIDTSGKRVKIHLNVQKDKILLTILKGSVTIQNYVFSSNKEEIIQLKDLSKVIVDDVMLQFLRKKVI